MRDTCRLLCRPRALFEPFGHDPGSEATVHTSHSRMLTALCHIYATQLTMPHGQQSEPTHARAHTHTHAHASVATGPHGRRAKSSSGQCSCPGPGMCDWESRPVIRIRQAMLDTPTKYVHPHRVLELFVSCVASPNSVQQCS